LQTVINATPTVLNHNIETVSRLYPEVRPQADYMRSLELLRYAKQFTPSLLTKSGLMVGLGETKEEILEVMNDLSQAGCDFLTIGQYLQPSRRHYPVTRYITQNEFEKYRKAGEKLCFRYVASGPLVRSSNRAAEMYALVT
jgi:lipoic acid synthetase